MNTNNVPDGYLGDGLYIQDCYFQLRLYTPQGDEVFLDDDVLQAFFKYVEKFRHVVIDVQPSGGHTE